MHNHSHANELRILMRFTTGTNPIIHLLLLPKNLHRHCFRLLLGHFHVPGEIANNCYANVLGGNRGVLWDCASGEFKLMSLTIVEHQDSLRNRDIQQLGNGPLSCLSKGHAAQNNITNESSHEKHFCFRSYFIGQTAYLHGLN